ncbi:MAG: hypothetical protein MUC94_10875 [bacterium]|nr:hypothetical protein [bacterium]
MKKQLIGQATPEQIAAWKKEFGTISCVIVDGHICYLKKPDRNVISLASIVGKDPIRFNETLIENCFIGGSEEIKTDDDLFLSASSVLPGLIETKVAELKKL